VTSLTIAPAAVAGPQLSRTIAGLFPRGVLAAELRGNFDDATLLPEEERLCAGFSAKRTADFSAGRACARRALAELGHSRYALGRNSDGRPNWPAHLVGSISHTAGFCGAVVAHAASVSSIGFDAEGIRDIDEEMWPTLFTEAERAWLASLPAKLRVVTPSLVFSAKEAYYKCHFGLHGSWLDFTDVSVTFPDSLAGEGVFKVRPAPDCGVETAVARSGRYAFDRDILLTGVATLASAKTANLVLA
jgi:4'-phosphopantetheinyl transferase EntD